MRSGAAARAQSRVRRGGVEAIGGETGERTEEVGGRKRKRRLGLLSALLLCDGLDAAFLLGLELVVKEEERLLVVSIDNESVGSLIDTQQKGRTRAGPR